MKRIFELIHQNLDDEKLRIKDICRNAGISRMHLHRKIKSVTGLSTSHYIRQLRLERSKDLLQKELDLNISEVAYKVGFKDPNYFTRVFRQTFGVTPSSLRQLR